MTTDIKLGMVVGLGLVLTVAVLVRLRPTRAGTLPFKASGDLKVRGLELPMGLLAPGLVVGGSVLATMLSLSFGITISYGVGVFAYVVCTGAAAVAFPAKAVA